MRNATDIVDNEDIFRSIVMESPIPIALLVGRELIITVANAPQLAVWGKGDTVFGLPLAKAIPEMEGQPFLAILDDVFTTGTTFATDNTPANMVVNGVEKTVYFNFSFKAARNQQGVIYGIIATGIEITQQIATNKALQLSEKSSRELSTELDRQVKERTQQLEDSVDDLKRSNQNLEQFAYIASHDLQEPLRKIQQFGDLLRDQYGSQLGDGVNFLERMQSAASRMSTLIKDLLSFSRISTQRDVRSSLSLNTVINIALTTLDLSIVETGAQVEIGELPFILGDPTQLVQLFQNLLSNALKFRRQGITPIIKVSALRLLALDLPPSVKPARLSREYYRIDITDNGIGFEEKYLDRIFQVFQRLHGKNEFPGTGIGLAICEKVITNHGGAITASSQPGQGATFSVYFPG